MRLVTDHDPVVDLHTLVHEFVDFHEKCLGIDDYAVADHARDARVKDARGYEAEDELGPPDKHGVAGVVTALIARDDVEPWCQEIDNFSLALVAPLGTEHRQIHDVDSTLKLAGAGAARPKRLSRCGFGRFEQQHATNSN